MLCQRWREPSPEPGEIGRTMKVELWMDMEALVEEIVRCALDKIRPVLEGVHRPNNEDRLIDVGQLSEHLGVTRQWVYERVHANEILHDKLGKCPWFRLSELEPWLAEHQRGCIQEGRRVRSVLEGAAQVRGV